MVATVLSKLIASPIRVFPKVFVCCSTNVSPRRLPNVTLFTKHPCSLCEDAKQQLKPYSNRFHLEEVDITYPMNKEWFEKYRYDIPVFHFEGKYIMKHKVDVKDFESALIKFETSEQPS